MTSRDPEAGTEDADDSKLAGKIMSKFFVSSLAVGQLQAFGKIDAA